MTILLLTTTGRKTGKSHTTPLGYITDGGNYIVVASNGGKNVHPAWWLNLEHNPQAMIQIGETQKPVVTERAAGDEENRLWGEVTKVEPAYGNYRSLSRGVPIVILHPQTE